HLPRVFEPTDDTKAREEEQSQTGSASILLVEDESEVRALVKRILDRRGYTVTDAASGEEAVEACRARTEGFQLLITDIVLSGMRGTEVADSVRSFFPNVRVMYMTGYADKGDAPQQEDVPILQKPFSSTELLAQVKNTLAHAPGSSILSA
ncbi:MAG: response regulator, partial [Spirochaetia bacterium]